MSVKPVPLEPIAIVGSSCRFAGDATSPSKLWDLLRSPRDVQSKVPDTRYSVEGYYHPDPAHHGHTNVKHAYLLSQDTSVFDAEFFGINGLESRAMDPQQRMLLEVVYESIDDAGMTIEGLRGSNTAVYAGLMSSEYEFMLLKDLDAAPTYLAAGIGRSILSNRISYFFDWHGASMTIDTACSSSLVAVHQAVQSLRAGESTMAVACGANLVLGPESYIIESKVKMLSPKGRCRMWDKDAAGYVRGDGVAAVILKPLNLALKDGDTIHCLIRETGIGQDGATPGLTMPSATAQRELIQSTYLRAGLDPFSSEDQPQYFEAHGTGTPAGDPVECEAIHTAFFGKGKPPARDHPLYCGSIKTILGHTEGTAGIAGILKASLAIKNSVIPPNLLFDNLSPSVAPFYHGLEIRRTARPWPETSKWQPKRASVNSFGFGGTNAHAILESYENPGKCNSQEYHLFTPFVFSAASETSLRANVAAYARYLNEHPDLDVQNLAYTLRQRRSVFAYRTSFPPTSLELLSTNIIARLQNLESPLGVRTSTRSGRSSRILGIFTGQGAQYAQMGAEIIEKSAYAQRLIDELEAYLARLPSEDRPPWSLKDEILRGSSTSRINEAAISQPLCTAIQILIGTLSRGMSAIQAFSSSLGFLWSHLKNGSMDLNRCQIALSGQEETQFSVAQGLPSYQWNHETRHWHESRRSRKMRLRQKPFHPLLGHVSPDSAPHHLRWKNVLKPTEIAWLDGHRVQNQIVFPASGYISTAIEAARHTAHSPDEGEGNIRLIEVSNFYIHHAITFEDEDTGVEVLIELSQISYSRPSEIVARFSYSAALGRQAADLTLAADGDLKIYLGDASLCLLPERSPTPPYLIPTEESRLYKFLKNMEYNFTGAFRSLHSLRRKLGRASCLAKRAITDDSGSILVHPIDLDAAFQSVMLAYSYPGDDQLRVLHLPSSISKVRVNPALFTFRLAKNENLAIDSTCIRADRVTPASGFSGSVNVYATSCPNSAIQVDQLRFKPLGTAATEDRKVFYKMNWIPSAPDGVMAADGIELTQNDTDLLRISSRIATYYLRKFDMDIPENSPARSEAPLCHYLRLARTMTGHLKAGTHKHVAKEWENDTLEDVMNEVKAKRIRDLPNIKILVLVGETMPRVFTGETTMLEHLRLSGLLDEYYEQGVGTTQSNIWLSQAVKQITDRYPHVNILEIGGGTGGATKKILKAIDHSFDRYTFTDISPSFFENATEVFSPWQNKMVYKVCDAEKDPLTQGFVEGENDVVVASFVIHATAHLEKTMRNLRKLLKPGGFLVVGEGTRNGPIQIGTGFIFGTLPGWWLGVAEGRDLSPFVDISEWDVLLRRTGFSGIDTSAPPNFENFGLCLFVSQAVDDRVSFIRDPLSAPAKANIRKLVIVGGKTKVVRRLVEELTSIFKGILDDIITYETLQDVDFSICDTQATVISLSELDHPIFKNLTSEKWDSFRRMFESERTVLWVTSGRIADEPFSNMVVGFGRSAASEVEDLRLKFLDIPDASHADPKVLAESLIQLHARDIEDGSILGVAETEVIIDQDCHQLVPRLRPIPAANDRYNSVRRTISHDIDVRDSELELWQDGKDYNVRQLSRFETLTTPEGSEFVELQTTHAVLSALKTPAGHKFLVLGVDSSGNRYVTLASSLKSRLMVSNESTLLCNDWGLSTESLLILVAATVVSMAIIDPLAAGQTIVVHNASKPIALIASTYASVKGIKVIFTTDFEQSSSSIPWIKLPPFLGQSGLRQIIPNDISCFVGFSNDVSENELAILSNLSPHTRIETTKSIYSSDAVDSPFSSVGLLSRTLQTLGDHIKDFKILSAGQVHKTISLESLARGKSPKDPVSIVDWTSTTTSLPVRVNRLDVNSIFKPDKTYWLCGMTGALGISLCDWMIDRGARYLAFTSRNPQIEPSWLQAHRRFGITIRIFSCDMTDERALSATHQKIVKTLPPIIGALSGAMVLRDVSVRNMEIDQVLDVIRPKVIGSMHLDQIFHDVNLDFFILMSSLNCVIGNVGQANYTAANMGLCSIATNRRKRGLNSSCINVGTVIGAGYITENQKQLDQTVARLAIMHLSEDDFHQIFAEGVEAGYLDSPNGPELSAGLLDVLPDSLNIPKWASNPKFAHLIVHHAAGSAVNGEQGNVASIQEQLGDCKTEQNVLQVIRQTFSAQLRKILQQSTADDELLEMDSTSLGLDSLLSVDIRAWFLKNFQVNIPVLKIMNNDAQMASLAEFAAVNIPATLVPQLDGGSASAGDGASRITAPPS